MVEFMGRSPIRSIRVLIADDHTIVRRGIRAVLSETAGIEVVGEAATGQEALLQMQELQPDVVLMDLLATGLNDAEATRPVIAGPQATGKTADNPG